ncbi:MAG: hypothetical protein JWN79_2829 [Gemmatimonadetes bacterium]|jgi:hypothetical protein|nr:hypothetical protein [Gemmatimonadota bacterium]
MPAPISRAALVAALLTVMSCGADGIASPEVRTESELNLLHVTYDYPRLVTSRVSFWAVKGKAAGADLWYHARAGASDSAKFVEFRMGPSSLDRRPDGTSIAAGDSVLITLTATDPTHMIIQYEPSGLRFTSTSQPTLRMFWTACGDDVNYDGKVDAADAVIASRLGVWRQEGGGAPWERLASTVNAGTREVSTAVSGFTGYALAY